MFSFFHEDVWLEGKTRQNVSKRDSQKIFPQLIHVNLLSECELQSVIWVNMRWFCEWEKRIYIYNLFWVMKTACTQPNSCRQRPTKWRNSNFSKDGSKSNSITRSRAIAFSLLSWFTGCTGMMIHAQVGCTILLGFIAQMNSFYDWIEGSTLVALAFPHNN